MNHRLAIAIVCLVAVSSAHVSRADDPVSTHAPPERATTVLREPTIYIPYEKLREVFEQQGRGVFLPYEEFQRLWQAARDATPPPDVHHPPIDTLITEVNHEAQVNADVMRVSSVVRVDLLTPGWHEIPLGLQDAAIMASQIDGRPAHIVFDDDRGYTLLLENDSTDTRQVELALEYAKAYDKTPGRNSVSFRAPQAPVSRWRIRIPEKGVKVDIDPLLAATEVPLDDSAAAAHSGASLASAQAGAAQQPAGAGAEETVIMAFVGAVPTVRIDWTPRAEGAQGLDALTSVTCTQQVHIDEGVVRTRADLDYTISRAQLAVLTIDVPLGHRVVNVLDANVRQWSVDTLDDTQRITVQLFEPATQRQALVLEFEKFLEDAPRAELQVPTIETVDVNRQQGIVAVRLTEGRRASALRHEGLLRLDRGELPEHVAEQPWALTYHYVTMPFDLLLEVEQVQPHIVAQELTQMWLRPDHVKTHHHVLFNVERSGVFRFELHIPSEYDISHVRGSNFGNGVPLAVDAFYRQPDDPERVVVTLARKASGRVGLDVQLHRDLNHEALEQPLAPAVELALHVPRVAPNTVHQRNGFLVVHAPEALRLNPQDQQGLRSVSIDEALSAVTPRPPAESADRTTRLAFSYAEQPGTLQLSVQRRKPHITVQQWLHAGIEAASLKYKARFTYDIRYSGVKDLQLELPAAVAQRARVITPGIREEVLTDATPAAAETVVWRLVGQQEFLGQTNIEVVWESPIGPLEVGDRIDIELPRVTPRLVDRAWGQVTLSKSETLDVQATGTPSGVRPIDPQHDLPSHIGAGAARAFEFQGAWRLAVSVARYALEEIKTTSIERAVVRMVVTRADETSVQALYRLRSRRQRLRIKLPPGATFDTEPVRINSRPHVLERGDQGDYSVPLSGLGHEHPIVMELRYSIPSSSLTLGGPEFPDEPAIQQVYVCAYLPEERAYLGSTGPWSANMRWRWSSWLDRRPIPLRSDRALTQWIHEGLPSDGDPAATFQTDGRLHLFSTLRPAAGSAGVLRLWTLDAMWLKLGVFAAMLILGVLLLPRRAATRFAVLAGVAAVLVLLSGFLPTLSRQLIDGNLAAAVFVVCVVWSVQYYAFIRPHDPVVAARRDARQASRIARIQATASRSSERAVPDAAAAPGVPSRPTDTAPSDHDDSDGDDTVAGGQSNA